MQLRVRTIYTSPMTTLYNAIRVHFQLLWCRGCILTVTGSCGQILAWEQHLVPYHDVATSDTRVDPDISSTCMHVMPPTYLETNKETQLAAKLVRTSTTCRCRGAAKLHVRLQYWLRRKNIQLTDKLDESLYNIYLRSNTGEEEWSLVYREHTRSYTPEIEPIGTLQQLHANIATA